MFPSLIEDWHRKARPNPTEQNFNVQLGCHFEEIAEQIETLSFTSNEDFPLIKGEDSSAYFYIKTLADMLKEGKINAIIDDRKGFLDSVGDQVVTGIGSAYCANMKATEAIRRINTSNWSKYDSDGNPIFNANGKIAKGPDYKEPDLEGCY
jgi:hypothetical protein